MPPQPRFNTGERLTALVMVLGTIVFGITGLAMWFLKGIMSPFLFQLAVFFHDLMFMGPGRFRIADGLSGHPGHVTVSR